MAMYDYVIIGSGLGGMECAYMLSKEGYNVCMLEKNRQLGGNLQIFSRDKAIFDTGIHYIGGLDEGQNLNQLFKYFELMDKLKLRRMDMDGFDRVSFDSDPIDYKYAQGWDNYLETMIGYFPHEKEGLTNYCDKLQEVCTHFPLYNLKYSSINVAETKYLDVNTKTYIEETVSDPKLRSVLAGTNPLYAGHEDKTPLYVHALIMNTYIESAWKCVDGGAQIAKHLARSIKDNGGTIINYADVKRMVVEGEGVKYVELADGEKIEGKNFISNVNPASTLEMLEGGNIRKAYRKRIMNLENSISIFAIHIVFKPNTFKYLNYNYYHFQVEDVWSGIEYDIKDWPEGYALFSPASSKSEEYADGLTVMCYMQYSEVAQWADTYNTIPRNITDRGDGYDEFREDRAQRIIVELEKKWPDLRSMIKSYHTTTPLSYRDYIGTTDGTMYGVVKDRNDPIKTFISPKTKIPNLLLTGQNLNLHGVLGVSIGAVITCSEILGQKYLLDKINQA